MEEIWRDIEGCQGYYQVSNHGRVKSLERKTRNGNGYMIKKETILKGCFESGALRVKTYIDNKMQTFKVFSLVSELFLDNPNNKIIINHINGDKMDNRVANLEWDIGTKDLDGEIWRDIKGHEGYYQVSNLGRIKSLEKIVKSAKNGRQYRREMIMSPKISQNGYVEISLYKNGCATFWLVHRVVAKAFIPNPFNKRTINHKNGNKTDNSVENLEWATYSENTTHAFDIGLNKNVVPVIGVNIKTKEVVEFCRTSKAVEYLKKGGYPKAGGTPISRCCRGDAGFQTAYGYKWKYKNKNNLKENKTLKILKSH